MISLFYFGAPYFKINLSSFFFQKKNTLKTNFNLYIILLIDKNSQLRRDDPSSNEMEMILTPTDHLSPPSTMSRFSDSDTTSDVDYDGMNTGRDGASISSVGSSSSPPPEV